LSPAPARGPPLLRLGNERQAKQFDKTGLLSRADWAGAAMQWRDSGA